MLRWEVSPPGSKSRGEKLLVQEQETKRVWANRVFSQENVEGCEAKGLLVFSGPCCVPPSVRGMYSERKAETPSKIPVGFP